MYHRGYFSKKKQFDIKDGDFPVLTQAIIKECKLNFKDLKSPDEDKEKEIKDGWTKLYYKNNKIIRKDNPVKKPKQTTKLKRELTLEEKFCETIVKMRERWETYNMENGYEVDYDYYCDRNEYDSEPEDASDVDEYYDMNEDLIENKHYDD
tara:strand:+ start:266 stop:718 length:453 start_codon:yes stop_codon:yes gene_type:complete